MRSGGNGGGSYNNDRTARTSTSTSTHALPRPPSLKLLEEVIMPAVGQCCVDNGIASLKLKNIRSRSLTLLACIDESISFLSETYSTV